MKRATCYLVLEPRHDYAGRLLDVRVDRMTTNPPTRLGAQHVALKINVDVADTLFEQYLPEVTLVVSDRRDLITPTVEVETPILDVDVILPEEEPDEAQG